MHFYGAIVRCLIVISANPPSRPPSGYNDAGVQLNRTREYIEREQIARRIQEERNKQQSEVEAEKGSEQGEASGSVLFLLQKVVIDDSQLTIPADLKHSTIQIRTNDSWPPMTMIATPSRRVRHGMAMIAQTKPNVVLLDVHVPGGEGGGGGGTIVTQGTPEQVAECEASWTGKFLKPML